jgi:hypothetical protein
MIFQPTSHRDPFPPRSPLQLRTRASRMPFLSYLAWQRVPWTAPVSPRTKHAASKQLSYALDEAARCWRVDLAGGLSFIAHLMKRVKITGEDAVREMSRNRLGKSILQSSSPSIRSLRCPQTLLSARSTIYLITKSEQCSFTVYWLLLASRRLFLDVLEESNTIT